MFLKSGNPHMDAPSLGGGTRKDGIPVVRKRGLAIVATGSEGPAGLIDTVVFRLVKTIELKCRCKSLRCKRPKRVSPEAQ